MSAATQVGAVRGGHAYLAASLAYARAQLPVPPSRLSGEDGDMVLLAQPAAKVLRVPARVGADNQEAAGTLKGKR